MINRFGDLNTFYQFFLLARMDALALECAAVPLGQLSPEWAVTFDRTYGPPFNFDKSKLIHELVQMGGEHLKVIGMAAGRSAVRRLMARPLFAGKLGDHVALIVDEETSDVLVRLRSDIGTPKIKVGERRIRVVVSPPVLLGEADMERRRMFKRVHGFIPVRDVITPFCDLIERPGIMWEPVPQDGRFFFRKVDRHAVITADRKETGGLVAKLGSDAKNYAWVSLGLLNDLRREGCLDAHLRAAMAILMSRWWINARPAPAPEPEPSSLQAS